MPALDGRRSDEQLGRDSSISADSQWYRAHASRTVRDSHALGAQHISLLMLWMPAAEPVRIAVSHVMGAPKIAPELRMFKESAANPQRVHVEYNVMVGCFHPPPIIKASRGDGESNRPPLCAPQGISMSNAITVFDAFGAARRRLWQMPSTSDQQALARTRPRLGFSHGCRAWRGRVSRAPR